MTGIKTLAVGVVIGLIGSGLWSRLTGNFSAPGATAQASTAFSPSFTPAPGRIGAAAAQRFAVPAPAPTVEGLLAQFLAIIGSPDTELNRLRLKGWLERIRKSQLNLKPDFQ